MNRVNQSQNPARRPGRYNDVLGLAPFLDGPLKPAQLPAVRNQLIQMGYSVAEAGPGHWILAAPDGPGQIHLYGARELAVFANRMDSANAGQTPSSRLPSLSSDGLSKLFTNAGDYA